VDAIESALHGGAVDLRIETWPELAALRGCPQTVAFHAEGDVATHSSWVYELACEHADSFAEAAKLDPDDTVGADEQGAALRLAGLLRDLGKPATTKESGPDRWTAHGHDLEGARLVSSLFATHPALLRLPLGVYASVHAMVRAHMWSYAGDRISSAAALRLSHVNDPRLLMALWDSESRGRSCPDAADLAKRVGFARLVLEELDAARPDSHGLLDQLTDRASVSPRAWRETFRALVQAELPDVGAVRAHLATAERHSTGGSITYTIGLPSVGKSTWAREVWAPATDGVVLSAEGGQRRDRRTASSAVLERLAEELAAGRHVCVDSTHLLRETRNTLITYAGRHGAALHAVYFRAPLSRALRRQALRPSAEAVPAAAITEVARELRWPTPDEYQTLSVVEPNGRAWAYNPESRWLTGSAASLEHPVTATPWSDPPTRAPS
jgi:predicted kinase